MGKGDAVCSTGYGPDSAVWCQDMVIVKLSGGLGNQMFQYATARRLSLQRRTQLRVDIRFYGGQQRGATFAEYTRELALFQFNVACSVATERNIRRIDDTGDQERQSRFRQLLSFCRSGAVDVVKEKSSNFDETVLSLPKNVFLDGYWQSEKYFADVATTIRQDFTFVDQQLAVYARTYVENMRRQGEAVVGLHVRRGDLAYAEETLRSPTVVHGPTVSQSYIREAMALFGRNCVFLVFSDSPRDIQWCRENIRGKYVRFSEGHTDLQDFAIMQSCDHNIISNSTFSWWAAWLNANPAKRVVAPRQWFNARFAIGHRIRDLIPEPWTLLG